MTTQTSDAAANPLAALSSSLASIVESVGASTLGVHGRHRHGLASGVMWRSGILVTVAHVFRRTPATVSVVAEDGRELNAALVGIDSSTDIAVFRLVDDSVPAATLGDASSIKAGNLAIAVGRSPQGDLTASYGLVNRTSGPWETWLGGQVDRLIRLDGGIYDGLSGGPVADASGAVFGIATAALSRTYGVVVPASTVSRIADALLTKGHVTRAFLGIGAQPVPLTNSRGPDEPGGGVGLLITSLVSGGPADTAGILVGDIFVSVDGKPASSLPDLRVALAEQIGKPVTVSMVRAGQRKEVSLTVGQWPTQTHHC